MRQFCVGNSGYYIPRRGWNKYVPYNGPGFHSYFFNRPSFPDDYRGTLLRAFYHIHRHATHETPIGLKHNHWQRAEKRMYKRLAIFTWQTDRDY